MFIGKGRSNELKNIITTILLVYAESGYYNKKRRK